MMNGDYGFGHAGGGFIGIIFWIIVIVAIVAVFRWLADNRSTNNRSKTALDILDERYARGEIDREEYEQKRNDLIKNQ